VFPGAEGVRIQAIIGAARITVNQEPRMISHSGNPKCAFVLACLALLFPMATAAIQLDAQAAPLNASGQNDQRARYALQRSDVVMLSFPLSPELNQTLTIQPDGYINLQDAGGIYVAGLTAPELLSAVKKAYFGILHDPIVNVDVVDFQKPYFTVSGQVGKPGQYELRQGITVAEALAVAGGMVPTAKQQVFLLRRTPDGNGYEARLVDVRKVVTGKDLKEAAQLKPGDMIYVPEKFIANFRKYLPYSVNAGTYLNPGNF